MFRQFSFRLKHSHSKNVLKPKELPVEPSSDHDLKSKIMKWKRISSFKAVVSSLHCRQVSSWEWKSKRTPQRSFMCHQSPFNEEGNPGCSMASQEGATCPAPVPALLPLLLCHLFWMVKAGTSWNTLNYLLWFDFCNEMLALSVLHRLHCYHLVAARSETPLAHSGMNKVTREWTSFKQGTFENEGRLDHGVNQKCPGELCHTVSVSEEGKGGGDDNGQDDIGIVYYQTSWWILHRSEASALLKFTVNFSENNKPNSNFHKCLQIFHLKEFCHCGPFVEKLCHRMFMKELILSWISWISL